MADMKILQLIDTLHPGGAERMAVNYANSILKFGVQSHLVVSREEGTLRSQLHKDVNYHFLNKKHVLDIAAFQKLQSIIRANDIDIIHAHGSSWFFAVLCTYFNGSFKLIWHDHYGNSEFLIKRNREPLRFFSRRFDGIISVNQKLFKWSQQNLACQNLLFLNNYVVFNGEMNIDTNPLMGNSKFKLICVANFRPQKNHLGLINAFNELKSKFDVSLHLIGKSFEDEYSKKLLMAIQSHPSVYYYGVQQNIHPFLKFADIGILASISEGLPLVLLEYGLSGLPVVYTDVGECKNVVGADGWIVESENLSELCSILKKSISNSDESKLKAESFKKKVEEKYSETAVITEYFQFCESL